MAYFQATRERYFVHDTFHQRGFSLTVLTHKCHFLAALDGERHLVEHLMLAVFFTYAVANHRIITTAQAGRELQMHGSIVHFVDFNGHNLLKLLHFLLHLHGFCGLIAEAVNESAHVGNLFLLVLVGAQLLFSSFCTKFHILIIFDTIVNHLAA